MSRLSAEQFLPKDVIKDNAEIHYGECLLLLANGAVDKNSVTIELLEDGYSVYGKLTETKHVTVKCETSISWEELNGNRLREDLGGEALYILDASASFKRAIIEEGKIRIIYEKGGLFGLWRVGYNCDFSGLWTMEDGYDD